MALLKWDKILESCVNGNWSVLLVVGQPPLWRTELGLRPGLVSPLTAQDLALMLEEILKPSHRVEEAPGCRSFRLTYGSDLFRIDVLGSEMPTAVIATRLPPNAPKALREDFGWYEGWRATNEPMTWSDLLTFNKTDAILASGCPPLGWSEWGVHVYGAEPRTDAEIAATILQIKSPPELCSEEQGYLYFSIKPLGMTDQFRVAVFNYPAPSMILFLRMSSNQSPGVNQH